MVTYIDTECNTDAKAIIELNDFTPGDISALQHEIIYLIQDYDYSEAIPKDCPFYNVLRVLKATLPSYDDLIFLANHKASNAEAK